jgi:phospholipid transport system transporter-binding protein
VTAAQLHRRAEGLWELSGDITLANVPALYQNAAVLVQSAGEITIDMAPVARIDSSSIALMLSWRRAAKAARRSLVFRNVPPQVLAVARLCGVLELLPLASATAG